MQSLGPLFALGGKTVVGMYDGHYLLETVDRVDSSHLVQRRHVFYLGAAHDLWTDPTAVEELKQQLERRQVQWRLAKEQLAPWEIVDSVSYWTTTMLASLEGRKYFPACHVEREDLAREWRRFVEGGDRDIGTTPGERGSRRYRSGLVLVGLAGSGKTAWVCHAAHQLLSDGVPSEAGETGQRGGRNLVLLLRGDDVVERQDREDRLLVSLLERMGLRDQDFATFDDLLVHLDKRWSEDRVEGRRLVVYLDAVNEAQHAENLFREVLQLIGAASRVPWCRVVMTVRREFLGVLTLGARAFKSKDLNYFYVEGVLEAKEEDREPTRQKGRFEDPNMEVLEKSGEWVLDAAGKPIEVKVGNFRVPKRDWVDGQPPMIWRKKMNYGYGEISEIDWVDCV